MSLKEKKSIHKRASPSFYFFKHYNGKINIAIKKKRLLARVFWCFLTGFVVILKFFSFFSLFSLIS
jgi:hypothetical protein